MLFAWDLWGSTGWIPKLLREEYFKEEKVRVSTGSSFYLASRLVKIDFSAQEGEA